MREAETALRTVLEITDGEVDAVRLNLAQVLVRLERDSEALVLLREILRSDPRSEEGRRARIMKRKLDRAPLRPILRSNPFPLRVTGSLRGTTLDRDAAVAAFHCSRGMAPTEKLSRIRLLFAFFTKE